MTDNIKKKFCFRCGKELYEDSVICTACGVQQPSIKNEDRSKLVAAMLAFFLGFLGIHKFYLGLKRAGVTYLLISLLSLLFLSPILIVISFIESIKLLLMPQADFDRIYNG